MRALVTGATGFLGRRVVPRLVERGIAVRAVVRPSSDTAPLLAALAADKRGLLELALVRSDQPLGGALLEDVSHVFHVAATIRASPPVVYRSNVSLTRQLATAAVERGVERFVLVSSIAVYGSDHLRRWSRIDESCPLDPHPEQRDVYTFSKVMQEHAAWAIQRERGLPLTVVRPGVLYGPEQDMAVARLGLAVGPLLLRVAGSRPLPYCYVDNAADAVVLAGLAPGASGRAFNVVDDELPRFRQVLRTNRRRGRRYFSLPLPYSAMYAACAFFEWYHARTHGMLPLVLSRYRAQAQWRRFRYGNGGARQGLGWQPAVPLAEALRLTAQGAAAASGRS